MNVLIILDPQADFMQPGDDEVLAKVEELGEKADVVIATQSCHSRIHPSFAELGVHCVKGSKGAKMVESIHELADYVTTKDDFDREAFSAFESSTLRPLESLEMILAVLPPWISSDSSKNIWVCGWGHAWDVPQTAFDANALGYNTTAFIQFSPNVGKEKIERMIKAGIQVEGI